MIRRLATVALLWLHISSFAVFTIVDEHGVPGEEVLTLLSKAEIAHDGSLSSIVQATQKAWLRKQGIERWEIEEQDSDKVEQFYALFEKLGMMQEIDASSKEYDYVLFLGCSLPAMRERIVFFLKQWEQGVRCKHIVLAGGPRPLDAQRESLEKLTEIAHEKLPFVSDWQVPKQLPDIEFDMMKLVWQQSDLPKEIRSLPVTWVQIPMKELQEGKLVRPGTVDLLQGWLATGPEKGTCLVISSQPFVGYQHAAVRTVLNSHGHGVETIGYKAVLKNRLGTYFDTIARWLYQEKKRLSV